MKKVILSLFILSCALNFLFAVQDDFSKTKEAMKLNKKPDGRSIIVTNNFYDLIVQDVGDGLGTYTVRTGSSHPATIAMGSKQNVLYGGASGSPWSTYLSVKSYSSNRIYVTNSYATIPDTGYVTIQLDPYVAVTQPSPTSILSTWNLSGEQPDSLRIEQRTYIEGTTLDDSKIGVTTKVKNIGATPRQIGIRYEWDIMIDCFD